MKLVIGNQKTYLNSEEINDFIRETNGNEDVIVCPSYLYIERYINNSKYTIGAQNVSVKKNTSTTGEISASQLKSMGVKYCIVGHSERRTMYNETSKDLVEKINRLFEEDIKVIFCVGEDYERKERGMTKEFVTTEIKEVFDKLDQDKLDNIIIAYEPIWAISNGITPSRTPLNEEIEEVTEVIKKLVYNTYNKELKVLYGGSVNSKNVDELNTISVVDGYLIGGASVKKDEFNYIMERCK